MLVYTAGGMSLGSDGLGSPGSGSLVEAGVALRRQTGQKQGLFHHAVGGRAVSMASDTSLSPSRRRGFGIRLSLHAKTL